MNTIVALPLVAVPTSAPSIVPATPLRGMTGLQPWAPPRDPSSAQDPVYAAIEKHEALIGPYLAAVAARADAKDVGDDVDKAEIMRLNSAIDATHLPLEIASEELIKTPPTTIAGVAAALRYFENQYRRQDNEGSLMIHGFEEDYETYIDWPAVWLETLAEATENICEVMTAPTEPPVPHYLAER